MTPETTANLLEAAAADLRARLLPHAPKETRYRALLALAAIDLAARDLRAMETRTGVKAQAIANLASVLGLDIAKDAAPHRALTNRLRGIKAPDAVRWQEAAAALLPLARLDHRTMNPQ